MSAFDWSSVFGPKLVQGTTESDTNITLRGKVVGVYFSAHWCGPCRNFTPELIKFYNNLSSSKNFEIVFASSDRDDSSFTDYFKDMPWTALPFSQRETKALLSSKYGVKGIPTLVWLDEQGELITKNGREKVSMDMSGASFPWRPKSLAELTTGPLVGQGGAATTFESLKDKVVFIYFSAHWCPPCKGFTPKLVDFYNHMKVSGKNFEVVFASSDRSVPEFNEYFGEMPWLALPHGDARIEELSSYFEVEGIPTLVAVDMGTGEVINKSVRGAVEADPKGGKFPFYPEPVEDLAQGAESYGFDLNDKPALILLMEAADDTEQEDALEAMKPLAIALAKDKAKSATGPEMIFFTNFGQTPLGERLRNMTGLVAAAKAKDPTLLLLDIPDNGGFYTKELKEEITEKTFADFIAQWRAKGLERKQLGRG